MFVTLLNFVLCTRTLCETKAVNILCVLFFPILPSFSSWNLNLILAQFTFILGEMLAVIGSRLFFLSQCLPSCQLSFWSLFSLLPVEWHQSYYGYFKKQIFLFVYRIPYCTIYLKKISSVQDSDQPPPFFSFSKRYVLLECFRWKKKNLKKTTNEYYLFLLFLYNMPIFLLALKKFLSKNMCWFDYGVICSCLGVLTKIFCMWNYHTFIYGKLTVIISSHIFLSSPE